MTDDAAERHRRDLYLRRIYGISADDFDALVEDAGGRCPICTKPFKGTPVVDHDHKTGIVRGVLCSHCNHRVLGRGRDADVFTRVAQYLTTPPAVRLLGPITVPKKAKKPSTRTSSRSTISRTPEPEEAPT